MGENITARVIFVNNLNWIVAPRFWSKLWPFSSVNFHWMWQSNKEFCWKIRYRIFPRGSIRYYAFSFPWPHPPPDAPYLLYRARTATVMVGARSRHIDKERYSISQWNYNIYLRTKYFSLCCVARNAYTLLPYTSVYNIYLIYNSNVYLKYF